MSHRLTVGLVIALALVAGLPNLPRPMHGDQVFTLQGAEAIDRGELLYRDFWDIRQPGLIAIYWVAGTLFGFDEVGIHLFELLFWLAFAMFVAYTWPRLKGEETRSIWPAIATAGWYWTVTGSVQQTQAEALVGPLLYLHVWLLGRGKRGGWMAAGVVAAGVLMLKLLFLPLLGLAWLFAANRLRRERGWRAVAWFTAAYLAVGAAFLVLSLTPWIAAGELGELSRTWFEYPSRMLEEIPLPSLHRLADAARWFGTRYGPLVVLAAIGAVRLWRSARREWVVFLLGWLVVGGFVIIAQRFSWWSYHFLLLAIPLGLLSAEGCSVLAQRSRLRIVLLVVLLAPGLAAVGLKWADIAQNGFCLTAEQRRAYQLQDSTYARADAETAFLRDPSSRPGPIFVAGEPIYYRMANRVQASAIHGWSLELYPAEISLALVKQLIHARPVYVFVDRVYYEKLIEERHPELVAWLRMDYKVLRRSDAGTWYELQP